MNDIVQKIKSPAIALIIVGIINGIFALLTLAGGVFRLTGINGGNAMHTNEAERMGFIVGTVLVYGIAFICLIAAPITIYGAMQMMNIKNYKFSKTAAILAIIPATSCCFLAGIPIGIWAFTVLGKPEAKAAFEGKSLPSQQFPPPPNLY